MSPSKWSFSWPPLHHFLIPFFQFFHSSYLLIHQLVYLFILLIAYHLASPLKCYLCENRDFSYSLPYPWHLEECFAYNTCLIDVYLMNEQNISTWDELEIIWSNFLIVTIMKQRQQQTFITQCIGHCALRFSCVSSFSPQGNPMNSVSLQSLLYS